MAITCTPYLNFAGNTRAAMEFYQGIFGGELVVLTFADMGITQMPADGVMHAALRGGPVPLYASDAMPGAEQSWGGTRVYISLMGEAGDLDMIRGWFEKLAEDGHVGQPLQQQVWGDLYGQVSDRFGIEWMVNAPGQPA